MRAVRPALPRLFVLLMLAAPAWAATAWAQSATPVPAAAPAAASSFSAAQRAEIVAIVRDALRADPSILRDAIASLQAEDARRQAGDAAQAIAGASAALLHDPADPVEGNPAGDVTVVEFYDPRCPYCRQIAPDLARLVAQDHGVRLVLKDLPVLGPASVLETHALLAAERQGAYGRLRDALMTQSPDCTERLAPRHGHAPGAGLAAPAP